MLREASRARSQGSAQHLGLQEANCLLIVHIPAIGNAYAVLSNPEKRKQYDQYGDEKLNPARHGHSHADFHRGFEADISPEDLFNMFFGGGFPSSKHVKPCCPEAGLDVRTKRMRRHHATFRSVPVPPVRKAGLLQENQRVAFPAQSFFFFFPSSLSLENPGAVLQLATLFSCSFDI